MINVHHATRTPVWKDNAHEGHYDPDPVKALAQADGHYTTLKFPLYYKDNNQDIPTGKVGLIRGRTPLDPERRFVGIATDRYEPIQHTLFADACRPVAEKYPLSMVTLAGTYREHLWLAFDLGQYPVGGIESEMIQQYLYGGNCNDGGTGISLAVKTERLYCQNQLPTFFNKSSFSVRIRHSAGALLTTQQWVKYLEQVQRMAKAQQEQFDRLVVTNVVKDQIIQMVEAAYPLPKSRTVEQFVEGQDTELTRHLPEAVRELARTKEGERDRIIVLRGQAYRTIQRTFDESPLIAGTAYGAFNGVTFEESWRLGKGAGESVLFGARAKTCERAFEMALSFTR